MYGILYMICRRDTICRHKCTWVTALLLNSRIELDQQVYCSSIKGPVILKLGSGGELWVKC